MKNYHCMFCREKIVPEASRVGSEDGDGYLFQCENPACGAIYESAGRVIPRIKITYVPDSRIKELDFEEG
jgi:hypothetical protein